MDLDRFVTWMREKGVVRLRITGIELELGAPVVKADPPEDPLTDAQIMAQLARDRQARDALLFASSEGFPGFDDE